MTNSKLDEVKIKERNMSDVKINKIEKLQEKISNLQAEVHQLKEEVYPYMIKQKKL
jgi:uncharacterized protein YlxW (UPF0749 family)